MRAYMANNRLIDAAGVLFVWPKMMSNCRDVGDATEGTDGMREIMKKMANVTLTLMSSEKLTSTISLNSVFVKVVNVTARIPEKWRKHSALILPPATTGHQLHIIPAYTL